MQLLWGIYILQAGIALEYNVLLVKRAKGFWKLFPILLFIVYAIMEIAIFKYFANYCQTYNNSL